MRLDALKRNWNRLGRHDPLWAVLTDAGKRRGAWDRDLFFRSGSDEVAALWRRAEQLGVALPLDRALDFGCGVGRLTQALASRFERCDGVDISASMLRAARRYDRHPGRCFYHLNVRPDLALFADSSFSFVVSMLVLQHVPPRYVERYLGEMLRVLAPGGLLVFQLPSHRASREPAAGAMRTPIAGRLPAGAFNAVISTEWPALTFLAGQETPLRVTVENRSPHAWSCLPNRRGRLRINLANHWLERDGSLLQRDDARCPLSHDLAPGERADLMLGVTAPRFDGRYWLELDLVQEDVGWFAQRGSRSLRIPCEVTGGGPRQGPQPLVASIPAAREPAPLFRDRHPRIFLVLEKTGVRDRYWSWRRALDRIKARRDRLVVATRERVYDRIVPSLVNWWLGRPFAARMEMHCVPRAEVIDMLAAGGGQVVDIEVDLMPGGFQSYTYWVRKA